MPSIITGADGGTLFLDEIGEATAEVQAMLLRVLESRQVVPVGAHQPISVDVRLVAATDSELSDEEIEEAMETCGFEPAAAARYLGISRPSLYKLVRQHPTLLLPSST